MRERRRTMLRVRIYLKPELTVAHPMFSREEVDSPRVRPVGHRDGGSLMPSDWTMCYLNGIQLGWDGDQGLPYIELSSVAAIGRRTPLITALQETGGTAQHIAETVVIISTMRGGKLQPGYRFGENAKPATRTWETHITREPKTGDQRVEIVYWSREDQWTDPVRELSNATSHLHKVLENSELLGGKFTPYAA